MFVSVLWNIQGVCVRLRFCAIFYAIEFKSLALFACSDGRRAYVVVCVSLVGDGK